MYMAGPYLVAPLHRHSAFSTLLCASGLTHMNRASLSSTFWFVWSMWGTVWESKSRRKRIQGIYSHSSSLLCCGLANTLCSLTNSSASFSWVFPTVVGLRRFQQTFAALSFQAYRWWLLSAFASSWVFYHSLLVFFKPGHIIVKNWFIKLFSITPYDVAIFFSCWFHAWYNNLYQVWPLKKTFKM